MLWFGNPNFLTLSLAWYLFGFVPHFTHGPMLVQSQPFDSWLHVSWFVSTVTLSFTRPWSILIQGYSFIIIYVVIVCIIAVHVICCPRACIPFKHDVFHKHKEFSFNLSHLIHLTYNPCDPLLVHYTLILNSSLSHIDFRFQLIQISRWF